MTWRQVQKLSPAGPRGFGEAGHAALEGVAVEVRHAGQREAGTRSRLSGPAEGCTAQYAALDVEADVS